MVCDFSCRLISLIEALFSPRNHRPKGQLFHIRTKLSDGPLFLRCVPWISSLAVVFLLRGGFRLCIPRPWHIVEAWRSTANALAPRIPDERSPTALYRRERPLPPAKGPIRPSP